VVNICCLVLRRDSVAHRHFRAPTVLPILGAICCAYLVTPLTGRDPQQYVIAGLLLAVGVVLWLITFFINRAMWGRQTYVGDPEALEGSETKR
jgi:APA family basic amino acid/polyamine antiporter